jgi:hypothetical protein
MITVASLATALMSSGNAARTSPNGMRMRWDKNGLDLVVKGVWQGKKSMVWKPATIYVPTGSSVDRTSRRSRGVP